MRVTDVVLKTIQRMLTVASGGWTRHDLPCRATALRPILWIAELELAAILMLWSSPSGLAGAELADERATVPLVAQEDISRRLRDEFRLLREESVVTGTWTFHPWKDSPVELERVTGKMLEQAGATNIGQVLQDIPAIEIRRTVSGLPVFQIQGLKALHTLFLINGQELIGRSEDEFHSRDLLASPDIDAIEVVKGGTSVQYGSDAIGGVINIRTRQAAHSMRTVGFSQYGRFNTVTTFAAPEFKSGKMRGIISAGVSGSDGFDVTPDARIDGSPDFSTKNVSGNFEYRFSPRTVVSVYTRYSDDERKSKLNSSAGSGTRESKADNQRIQTVAQLEWKPDSVSTFTLWGHYQSFQDDARTFRLDTGAMLTNFRRTDELWEPQFQYTRELGPQHLLTVGGEHDLRRARGAAQRGGKSELTESAMWVQDEIQALPWADLVLGGRYTTNSEAGGFFSPQTTVLLKTGEWRGRFTYTRGFRSPNLSETDAFTLTPGNIASVGNRNLQPEKSTSYTANLEYYFPNARIGASLFHHTVSNIIRTTTGDTCTADELAALGVPSANCFKAINVGTLQSQGFELDASLTPFPWLLVETGYMYQDPTNVDLDARLNLRSQHAWKTRIHAEYEGWAFTSRVRYYSSFGIGDLNNNLKVEPTEKAASNIQWDVRLARTFKNGLEVYGGAENLTQSRLFTRSIGIPQPGEQLWFFGARVAL